MHLEVGRRLEIKNKIYKSKALNKYENARAILSLKFSEQQRQRQGQVPPCERFLRQMWNLLGSLLSAWILSVLTCKGKIKSIVLLTFIRVHCLVEIEFLSYRSIFWKTAPKWLPPYSECFLSPLPTPHVPVRKKHSDGLASVTQEPRQRSARINLK